MNPGRVKLSEAEYAGIIEKAGTFLVATMSTPVPHTSGSTTWPMVTAP